MILFSNEISIHFYNLHNTVHVHMPVFMLELILNRKHNCKKINIFCYNYFTGVEIEFPIRQKIKYIKIITYKHVQLTTIH